MKKPLLLILMVGFLFGCKNESKEKTATKDDGEYELLSKAQTFFQPISSFERAGS